jgi:putative DNA methylase
MQQSIIGPGMGIFTRHAAVLEDDDSRMTVRTALSLINRAWDEIENEATEALDAPTQVAVAWFASFGMEARPAGDLITLANAKNVATQTLFDGRIFHDGRGRAALLPRDALPADWSPSHDSATAWRCVQHAIRVLNAADGGAEAASRVIAAMGPLAEPALGLAHRLFQIATERGWASEALAYNQLAEEWPRLLDLAPQAAARGPAATRQAEMFGA